MALIECSNCGNKISDKAVICTKCGTPVQGSIMQETDDAIADIMFREAMKCLAKGQMDEARRYINGLLAVKPSDPRFIELKKALEPKSSPQKPDAPTESTSPKSGFISCKHCGQKISAKAKKCPKCGNSLNDPSAGSNEKSAPVTLVSCENCGHKMSPRALKCPNCGMLTPIGKKEEQERKEREHRELEQRRERERKEQQERKEREQKIKAEKEANTYQAAIASLNNGNLIVAQEHIDFLLAENAADERYKKLKNRFDEAFTKRVRDLCDTIENCIASDRLDDAQEDLNMLVRMKADEASYLKLKDRLDDALMQHAEEQAHAARKRRILIGTVAGILITALLGVGVYLYHRNEMKQKESAMWQTAESTGNMNDIDAYLNDFPDGAHVAQVQELKAQLQEVADQWAKVESSRDAAVLKDFIDKHPDGHYHQLAVTALDKLLWEKASSANTAEAYTQYLSQCPQGEHADDAKQRAGKIAQKQAELKEKMRLTSNESGMVTSTIRSFFNAMASGNSSGMTACVSSPMSSFLGKKGATSNDVIAYMQRTHSRDVYAVSVSMGSVNVKKSLGTNGQPVYTATFGFDQRLSREDTSQETFAHYNGQATLNANGKITSLGLNKTSHY